MEIPSMNRYRRRMGFAGVDVRHDGSVLDFSVSPKCYNFDFSSGALRDGYGTANHAAVPHDAARYWVYRYEDEQTGEFVDQYVYQRATGEICYYDTQTGKTWYVSGVQYPPMDAINYRLNSKDILFLASGEGELMSWNGSRLAIHVGTPMISSMALHYERLFITNGAEPTKVFFSDDLDPTKWEYSATAGGFIELLDERGELNKVVSFGNYLYIFRDRGISRVTAFADQSEFSVTNLFVTAGRIYPQSIAKCGAAIMFLASDGLYVFDGYDCSRVLKNLDGLFVPSGATASAYFDGKYYLACAMDFGDDELIGAEATEHTANALLVYDVSTGEYSLSRGLDISFMNVCTFHGEDFLMVCDGGRGGVISRCGRRFDTALPKYWQSPLTDFSSPDKRKSVREIYVDGNAECSLTLSNGKRSRTVRIKSGLRRVRINHFDRKISVAVRTDAADCEIKPLSLVIATY